ncbi:MAG: long-chain fatty acid--CoA ligase [Anaerolineae bacterium]|nr:long-chain fatty acid--CoA ligase [Anaerolineae bacterium]
MMDYQLTLRPLLERAVRIFPKRELVTKVGTTLHRYTYADMYPRVCKLANVLGKLGVKHGDRVGTLAWNNYRHLELYFAVPCSGAVLHTLNLRLPPEQIIYIINHAEDKVLFVDQSLLPLVEKIASHLKTVKTIVVMADTPLQTSLMEAVSYEELLAAEDDHYVWPDLDERDAAAMCYTSGTTGNPKGVLYSHRSIYLHTMGICQTDSLGLSTNDTMMPVVPMFHVLAWGLPFAATLLGCKQVFPGPHLQPRDLAELIQDEHVTITAGVPTLWLGLFGLLEHERYDLAALHTMIVGGAAAPRSMIENYQKKLGLQIVHAWGMTETSPLGSVARLKAEMRDLPEEEQYVIRAKQGIPAPGVEIRAVDENGNEVPNDGKTMGELQIRGPWIASAYYNDPRSAASFMDGWFRTGDVITIDGDGYIQIVDRTKDLVKSGGEWISTIELESAIMAHPKVLEAAVIAVPHPKWQERPLALVVPRAKDDPPNKTDIYELLTKHFAKWQLPDDVVFVESIAKTSVGKFDKKVLREAYKEYHLPSISSEYLGSE